VRSGEGHAEVFVDFGGMRRERSHGANGDAGVNGDSGRGGCIGAGEEENYEGKDRIGEDHECGVNGGIGHKFFDEAWDRESTYA
jgi:hypothetical protein